jgi:hypothetical protein
VHEGRVARDDEQVAEARQLGDDVLSEAVREKLLLRIAAHVDQRQHGDGRLPGRDCRRRAVLDRSPALAAAIRLRSALRKTWIGRVMFLTFWLAEIVKGDVVERGVADLIARTAGGRGATRDAAWLARCTSRLRRDV